MNTKPIRVAPAAKASAPVLYIDKALQAARDAIVVPVPHPTLPVSHLMAGQGKIRLAD